MVELKLETSQGIKADIQLDYSMSNLKYHDEFQAKLANNGQIFE